MEVIRSGLLWDSRSTLQTLQESRAIAGSPPIREDLWKQAIDKHLDHISCELAAPFSLSAEAAEKLSKEVLEQRPRRSDTTTTFIEGLIRNYRRLAEPKLSLISERIEQSLSSVKADPQRSTSRTALVDQIRDWAALRLSLIHI